MFEKRKNVTKEEALRKACEENGLIYNPNGLPIDVITLIDDDGNELVIDKNLNIVNKN